MDHFLVVRISGVKGTVGEPKITRKRRMPANLSIPTASQPLYNLLNGVALGRSARGNFLIHTLCAFAA